MKKVVILANDTTYVYNLRFAIIKELIKQKYEIYIIAKILLFEKELRDSGCILINVNIGRHRINPVSNLNLLIKYKKILKKINPDYILSYNIKPNIFGGIISNKMNTKFMPNITGLGTALEYPGIIQKITIKLLKIGMKNANVVFFQNQDNIDFFIKHKIIPSNIKTVLLPGSGVDLNRHKLLKYPDDKKIKFLFISRIIRAKGIDIYLETAKKIREKYPNTEFHICGYCDDKRYRKIIKRFVKENIVHYHGEQINLVNYFQNAHCLVHPSYYPEGMSNVLLEASAHGRPIICTNRSGCKETVDDSKTGFVVPIKNTDKVVEAVEKIINMSNEDRKKMGLNGRKKIEKEFDRKIVVKKYMEELKL